jgi:hypothetical protein
MYRFLRLLVLLLTVPYKNESEYLKGGKKA